AFQTRSGTSSAPCEGAGGWSARAAPASASSRSAAMPALIAVGSIPRRRSGSTTAGVSPVTGFGYHHAPTMGETPTRTRHAVVGWTLALAAIAYLDRVCVSTAAPAIRADLHLSDAEMG